MMSQFSRNFAEYHTVGEAAEILGVTAATLRNWDRSGKLKPRRHPQNGYRIYLHEELQAILQTADRSANSEPDFAPFVDWSKIGETEHFVQFYERDDFLVDAVSGFVGSALDEGQAAMLIATPEHTHAIRQCLVEDGVDVSGAAQLGRFVTLDAAETLHQLMVGGQPNLRRFKEIIGGALADLGVGGRRVHAFGEMVALLWADGQRDAAVRLEEFWNELRGTHRFALCCAYPMTGFIQGTDGLPFEGICNCHSRVLPSESYSLVSDPNQRLREVAALQQKARSLESEIAHRMEIERALHRRERELQDFFENATEGLHKVGPDGRIMWANRAELALLGYEADEYVGHHIAEFHADSQVIADILDKLARGEDLINQEAELRCRDGSVKHVLINSNACFENGSFAYSRCFTRDVTDLMRAERDRALLSAIVETSDDAIISKGLDGTIRTWNDGAERLFGFSAAEAVGQHISLIVPPDRIAEETEILKRLGRGERIEHSETTRIAKDGRLVHVSLSISPIRDRLGRIVGASNISRDVTARRRADQALRDSEERYRRLTELLPVAVYSCEAESGRITYFNQKAAELWGRAPRIGETDERFCGSFKLFLPDGAYLPHDQCPMALALNEGRSFRNQEVVIERPDRSRLTALVNIDPMLNDAGDVVGAINVFLDVTALKRAEEDLRNQKESLQTLLETLPVSVFLAEDPECRTISGNRSAAELLRMPLGSSFSQSAAPGERPIHFRVLRQGEEVPVEDLPIQRAARGELVPSESLDHEFDDRSVLHTIVSARPLFDAAGASRGAVACMLDVTELKEAEIALREADRRKDEFLATLAHELRNPLAPIRSGLELLKIGDMEEAEVAEVRGIMERQMEHMTRLVDDLLDVSRITRNKIELRKRTVDFAEIVQSAVEASRPLIDESRHELTVSLPSEPVFLDADATRLAQVFSNLLHNSAKYTEPGGRISLRAEVRDGELWTIVEDNGIGIPCEALAYVFDMFRQVDGALNRSQGGLGIGLTLVRRLVEMHGGTIDVQSEGEGRGAAFRVCLPIAARQKSEGLRRSQSASLLTGRRILVVDDNRDSVFTMSSLLRVKGNEVRSAYDGLEALEVAEEFRPDIILMDVGMPKLNGYEAARRIRRFEWGRDPFIVTLSGWGQTEDFQKSADAGCSAHLTKPVDFGVLERLLVGSRTAST